MFLASQNLKTICSGWKSTIFPLFYFKHFVSFKIQTYSGIFYEMPSLREQHSNARAMPLIEAIIHAAMASFDIECHPPPLPPIIIYFHLLSFIFCPLLFTSTHCWYPFSSPLSICLSLMLCSHAVRKDGEQPAFCLLQPQVCRGTLWRSQWGESKMARSLCLLSLINNIYGNPIGLVLLMHFCMISDLFKTQQSRKRED